MIDPSQEHPPLPDRNVGPNHDAAPSMCAPELRDVWTKIIPFLREPGVLRSCNQYLAGCWDHLIYLEGELSCPYVIRVVVLEGGGEGAQGDHSSTEEPSALDTQLLSEHTTVPISLHKLCSIKHLCHLHLIGPLPNVTQLGRGNIKARECDTVASIVISGLVNLTQIQSSFLEHAHSVKEVLLEDCPKIVSFGNNVLDECDGVEKVNFLRLESLTEIGEFFLDEAKVLTEANFVDIPALTKVGYGWLRECPKLTKVTFTNLPKLENAGSSFIRGCKEHSLTTFAPVLPNLQTLNSALFNCGSLKMVDLGGLPGLTSLKNSCFSQSGVEVFTLGPGLPNLTDCDHDILGSCEQLQSVTFVDLPRLASIPQLTHCVSLKVVELRNLPALVEVGLGWLVECGQLESVRLSGLPKLDTIRSGFLKNTDLGRFSASDVEIGEGCDEKIRSLLVASQAQ